MADNQAMWIRKAKNKIRRIYYNFSYRKYSVLSIEGGQNV